MKIPFNVSARTARLIGRENVAHAEGAIIELVKNSYDADSDFSIIEIDPGKKQILIIDNGDGMTDQIIREHWMMIGTDYKENSFKSTKGRIKSGAKGIGRFALDRLGDGCTMLTLPKGSSTGYEWKVNWNSFEEKGKTISKVFADLKTKYRLNLVKEIQKLTSNTRILKLLDKIDLSKGTIIKIENLRDEWNEELSNKIYRSLEVLTPPEGQTKFTINFFNIQYPKLYGLIKNEVFKDYDYKVVATYKKNANRKLKITIHRNEFDYNLIDEELFQREDMKSFPFDKKTFKKELFDIDTSFYELMPGFRDAENKEIADNIGDFEFTFYFFKNSTPSYKDQEKFKYKSFAASTRKEWASKFGGIKLFRDNFRVRPYGEIDTASYDWLMLGERQARSGSAAVSRKGAFRVSPYQVAGTVVFSRLTPHFLEDKSSREGLVENPTFSLFKNLLLEIIHILEDDRSTVASNLAAVFDKNYEDEKNAEEANEIADDDDKSQSDEDVKEQNIKLKKGVRAQRKQLEEREEELVMSRALASAGILIASFSHEFNHIKNKLNNRAYYLKKSLLPLLPESKTRNLPNRNNPYYLVAELQKLDEKIKQWIEFSISLTRKDRRKSKKFNLYDYFKDFKANWNNHLTGRYVTLNLHYQPQLKNQFFIKMIELDVDTIFDNLLANSIEAFQRDGFKGKKEIDITLERIDENIQITYADTGPGLTKDFKKPEDIFKAFVTSKRDDAGKEIGTGLGMWLLKSAIDYNKGSIQLLKPKNGFSINVFLKAFK